MAIEEQPKKYRKKPVVVEAVPVGPGNLSAVARWCDGMPGHDGVRISTLEGVMLAGRGDYVIRGVKGEFYPCKPDIFEATYEEVTDGS